MRTTEDAISILFDHLTGSALESEITGSLCKRKRDPNSSLEDVVINCLPIDSEQLQSCVANVNIHVPDITINAGEMNDKQPNNARIEELLNVAVPLLTEGWGADYNFYIQNQTVIPDQQAGDHYINFRIEFNFENL